MNLSKNYTLVTAFFDIGREKWSDYNRGVDKYLANAKRLLSLPEKFIIFIEPKFIETVKSYIGDREHLIIPCEITDLSYYKYYDQIKAIMTSETFKNGLRNPVCPEVVNPFYDIIMFGKIELVMRAIKLNPFNSDRFVWIDFGIHQHVLKDSHLSLPLFPFGLPPEIKMLCRYQPRPADLNLETFYKSNQNRLAGTMWSGDIAHLEFFNREIAKTVQEAIDHNLVDCDQSIMAIVYLRNPEKFKLYYGDWSELIDNHDSMHLNLDYIKYIYTMCEQDNNFDGRKRLLLEIFNNIPYKLKLDRYVSYEPVEELKGFVVVPDAVMCHVGAKLGESLLPYAGICSKIYLLEANMAHFRWLQYNSELTKPAKSKIILGNLLIGHKKLGYSTNIDRIDKHPKPMNDFGIPTVKLDDVLINEQRLDLLFISGDYMPIILSSLNVIARLRPNIYCRDEGIASVLKTINYTEKLKNLYSYEVINKAVTSTASVITRVKLLCNWTSSEELNKLWSRMSKNGEGRWNNIQTVSDDHDIDYYVVINRPPPGTMIVPAKTIVFRMEPDTEPADGNPASAHWDSWYLEAGLTRENFLFFGSLDKHMNNNEYHLAKTWTQLSSDPIKKERLFSAIISGLNNMTGHKFRIGLARELQSKMTLDIYGKGSKNLFVNHLGELPSHDKTAGLFPYRYHLAVENCRLKNYYTEKLIDPILSECLTFYWGCPNIAEFLDPRAYILLPENCDIELAIKIITEAIYNDEWSRRLHYIRAMKRKILDEYLFYPRIEKIISK